MKYCWSALLLMPTKSGLLELPLGVLEPHDVMTSVAITLRALRAPSFRKTPRVNCSTFSLLPGSCRSPVADDGTRFAGVYGPLVVPELLVTHNRISNPYWQEGK